MNDHLIESISFQKVTATHRADIFLWLDEPHMQEFWDNSQEHRDDILNFINGRVTPSNYFNGIFTYWVGIVEGIPFCLILTAVVDDKSDVPSLWNAYRSKTGTTYSIDFGIGNRNYLGKKLASPTLRRFADFFQKHVDPSADTFFIDPSDNNPRAAHVYECAGFKKVGSFKMDFGHFKGEPSHLMVLTLE